MQWNMCTTMPLRLYGLRNGSHCTMDVHNKHHPQPQSQKQSQDLHMTHRHLHHHTVTLVKNS